MVFLFGMTRAEARTGHERSEKNVPVARFGARVRVAALSAASEPRRLLGCALVVSANARPRSGLGHWDTSLKSPRFIRHRRRFGDFCPRCASRLADTFVSIRRGAALKPPRCICHRQRSGGFPVPRKHHWRTDVSCQNTLRSSRDFHTPAFVKTSAYGNGHFYNQC